MKVKELKDGSIVWYKNTVFGIKGLTLSKTLDELEVEKIEGKSFDYNYKLKVRETKQGKEENNE